MKIILVNTPFQRMTEIMGNSSVFVSPKMPSGLLYIASYISKQGIKNVEVIDAYKEGISVNDLTQSIIDKRPDIVGITCLTSNAGETYEIGKRLKIDSPGTKIVLGNIHADNFPNFYLKSMAADIIVHGEGERTFYNIIRAIENNLPLDSVTGITYVNGTGEPVYKGPNEPINDLDSIPSPYEFDFPYEKYFIPEGHCALTSSRGCVNNCNFCVVHKNGSFRYHSPERVIDEIKCVYQRYGVTSFAFYDPLFIASKKRTYALCEMINKLDFKIKFTGEGHVNVVDHELLKALKGAGCYQLAYGIESGNQHILNIANKKIRLERVKDALQMTKDAGISTYGMFIIGLPGETKKTFEQTLKFAKSLPLDDEQFSIFTPYPGSAFYYDFINKKILRDNFETDQEALDYWERFLPYISFSKNKDPVYAPEGLTVKDLISMQKKAISSFLMRWGHIKWGFYSIRNGQFKNILKAFKSIISLFIK